MRSPALLLTLAAKCMEIARVKTPMNELALIRLGGSQFRAYGDLHSFALRAAN